MSVNTDFDPTADFTTYKTYGWASFAEGEVPGPADKRLMSAVDGQMQAKGYELVEEGGDLVLRYQTGVQEKIYVDNMRYGYGWGTTDVYQYEQGTLVLDMIDMAEREIVWKGTAKAAIDSSRPNPEKLQEAVARLFAHFPPS
jgi:hypothetical protein